MPLYKVKVNVTITTTVWEASVELAELKAEELVAKGVFTQFPSSTVETKSVVAAIAP